MKEQNTHTHKKRDYPLAYNFNTLHHFFPVYCFCAEYFLGSYQGELMKKKTAVFWDYDNVRIPPFLITLNKIKVVVPEPFTANPSTVTYYWSKLFTQKCWIFNDVVYHCMRRTLDKHFVMRSFRVYRIWRILTISYKMDPTSCLPCLMSNGWKLVLLCPNLPSTMTLFLERKFLGWKVT